VGQLATYRYCLDQVVAQALTIYNQLAVRSSGNFEHEAKKISVCADSICKNYRFKSYFLQGLGFPDPDLLIDRYLLLKSQFPGTELCLGGGVSSKETLTNTCSPREPRNV